ncbi:alcohol dehydrogenase catalytic domain-containing protein [Paenibacillus cisolokensis]|uniref:zinc-dependent alcohol dehydrogenase n=1 Tax=Paenibacillus cisolokensis TaxID=1658519 RepID=UPI003D268A12
MQALVIPKPHEIRLDDIKPQSMGPYDVRIKSKAVGICGTDLEILEGKVSEEYVTYPVVPGHEWSGVVVETGSEVKGIKPGDRVVAEGLMSCGSCSMCRQGRTNLCEEYDQLGFTRPGGGASLVTVPARHVHRIPDHLSFEEAVLVEPAATVMRGIMRTPIEPGMKVAVIGPGTLGLLTVLMLKVLGVDEICLIGRNGLQLGLGRELGASCVLNSKEDDIDQCVMDWTNGQGVDVSFETSGNEQAVKMSIEMVRAGGHAVLEGVAGAGKPLVLESDHIMLKDITVHGVFSYTISSWSKVLDWLATGKLNISPLITHRFSIRDYEKAFQSLRNKTRPTVKIVMLHEEETM